jgi:vitamin B12 transporter
MRAATWNPKMKHSLKLGLASLALINGAFADETPTYQLNDVVVTATRTPQPLRSLLGDATVISAEQIKNAGQSTLVELLQSQPGVEIVSNGGRGTTSSVFIRGAESTHTLVLLDGMRVGSATTGTTAFERIPLDQIERIEILRGPASHLYGSEAIGGVIQIFTKSGQGKPKPNFTVGVGSYNTQTLSGGYAGEVNGTRFSLQAGHEESDSFSAYSERNSKYANRNRDADGYRDSSLSLKLAQTLAEGQEIGANLFGSVGRVHYDSFTTTTDYYQDQVLSAFDVYSKNRLSANWQSTLRVGVGGDHYNDYSPAKTVYNTDQNQFSWQNDIALGPDSLLLGIEYLDQAVDSTTNYAVKNRTVRSAFAGYQGRRGDHSFQFNVRNDDNSQFGSHGTGYAGYGYRFSPEWRASASVSTAFKAPTFNNLYFPNSGNPNLRPEKARNKELALHYDRGLHHFSAVYFDNQVSDLINYPAPTYVISQIQQASLKGVTLSYQGQVGGYRVRANWDAQNPVDQASGHLLIRRARNHATLAVEKRVGEWDLGGEWLLSSERYADDANIQRMGGYGLVNLTASHALGADWTVRARVNNLFDKFYELIPGYKTPGANLFVSLNYQPR